METIAAADTTLYVTLSSGRDIPVIFTGTPPVCHCGEPAAYVLLMGAFRMWNENIPERAVPQCFAHLIAATRFGYALGRRMCVFGLDGQDVSALMLGPSSDLVAVR